MQKAAAVDDRWFCLNAALSDAAGSQAINVYEGNVFSSFFEVNQYSKYIWENLRADGRLS